MIDSIYIAMTGLHGYEQGLRAISNDTANMNTPGFKKSSLQFADLFYSNGNLGGGGASQNGQYGFGLDTLHTMLDFKQGELQTTGNELDLALDGQGLFTLKEADGKVTYTRNGQFKFDLQDELVAAASGARLMAQGAGGNLEPISLAGHATNAAKPTQVIKFKGNLSSTAATGTVKDIEVIDAAGATHKLSATLTKGTTTGTWNVALNDGSTPVGAGGIAFVNGKPDPAQASVPIQYAPPRQPSIDLVLDFSSDVTSFDSGGQSTLAFASQDGYTTGSLTGTSFDETGTLVFTYSNGQKTNGAQLALARFNSQDGVTALGGNRFEIKDPHSWINGVAGENGFGSVVAGKVESSNVDLSQEFSDLVIMQRGYQASSQVVSTANDMLSELFGIRGK